VRGAIDLACQTNPTPSLWELAPRWRHCDAKGLRRNHRVCRHCGAAWPLNEISSALSSPRSRLIRPQSRAHYSLIYIFYGVCDLSMLGAGSGRASIVRRANVKGSFAKSQRLIHPQFACCVIKEQLAYVRESWELKFRGNRVVFFLFMRAFYKVVWKL